METHQHDMANLFAQLGLPSGREAIDRFITAHSPLPSDVLLSEAPFWTAGQAAFLHEGMIADADRAVVIDALNSELRSQ